MSVYKPPGRTSYVYDFRRGGDRYRGSTGKARRREAEAVERQLIEEIEARLRRPRAGRAMRLGDLAGWWWTHHGSRDRAEATTWWLMENLLAGLGETTAVGDLDDAMLARHVAARRAEPTRKGTLPAPATVNREVELLRRMLRQSARPLALELPALDWAGLMRAEPRERVVEMYPAEEAALFAALRSDHHPLFHHYLLTGVRLAMAVGLRKADLDLAGGWVAFRGKAAPGAPEQAAHVLPVTPAMRRCYEAALAGNDTDHVFAYRALRTQRRPGQGAVIRGRRYPYTASYVDTIWDRAKAKAAESCPSIARLRLHDLRHTAATRFYRDSKDLRATQRLLGHRDARTTQKYAHVFDEDLAAAMRAHHDRAAPPKLRPVRTTKRKK